MIKKKIKIWETLNLNINFNTILDEPLPYIKHYEPITKDISNIKNVEMNNNYIYDKGYEGPQLSQEIFNNYDTIIIKSTTGTGKTSNTAHFINKFLESEKQTINNTTYKIMSIVSRVSLAQQHIESFKKENIFLDSYENIQNYEDKNIVICINSILKYSKYKPEFFNNYIVYIDEISTFTRHLTHNNQLNNILKPVYITLMKIINNCKKIIVSEALINDNVFNIIEKRKHETKILIKNSFKKYDGIKAIQHNDENEFLDLVMSHVKNNKYFLFGADSCDIITKYNLKCEEINKDDCILIKSKKKFKLNNVNEQFYKKFVFYSPSITCGIDFSIETKQDVFLYIKGDTIEPCDSFQQLTRTRNINNVYYYVDSKKCELPKFNNIENCKEKLIDISLTYAPKTTKLKDSLINVCVSIDENDEQKFNDNTFFKLFSYNEYINDIYKTNKEAHFKNILINNGFKLSEFGETKKLKSKEELKDIKDKYNEKKFNEHINEIKIDNVLEDNINFLNITEYEDKEKFKDVITDKYIKESYFNLIRYFYKPSIIETKLKDMDRNNVEYKAIYSTYHKIKLIHELEKELNIKPFDIQKLDEDKEIIINDNLIDKINKTFKATKTNINSYNKYIEYYINKLKNLFSNIEIIKSKKIQKNNKRCVHYTIDNDILKHYFDLYFLSNNSPYNFDPYLLAKYENDIDQFKIYNNSVKAEEIKKLNNVVDDDDTDDDEEEYFSYIGIKLIYNFLLV